MEKERERETRTNTDTHSHGKKGRTRPYEKRANDEDGEKNVQKKDRVKDAGTLQEK